MKRFKTSVREFPERANKDQEGDALLASIPASTHVIALDEHGEDLPSAKFSALMGDQLDQGRDLAFVIGGADGLSDGLRERANTLLRFGRMTWPHQIVRGLLFEQIYRAETILLGHPYHRV